MAANDVQVLGWKQLDRKLDRLKRSSSRTALRAGINAGMVPIARALRTAVNATSASPQLKRAARKAIGKRFAKAKRGMARGQYQAKVGFGVGKMTKRAREKAEAHAGRGVGITKDNIHWFVLGTDEREQKTTGRATGRIAGIFEGLLAKVAASSAPAALEAARAKISQVIHKEALRR